MASGQGKVQFIVCDIKTLCCFPFFFLNTYFSSRARFAVVFVVKVFAS